MTSGVVRAVSYSRVSTEAQATADKSSIQVQQKLAEQAATTNGWQLVRHYVDAGVSGEKLKERTALQELLRAAKEWPRQFDVVIVYNGDRLARRADIYAAIVQQLEGECNIPILDLSKPLPVDPARFNSLDDDSRLLNHTLSGLFANLDQRTRLRRLQNGKIEAVRRGKFINPHVPYGYKIEESIQAGKLVRTPVPDPSCYWVVELLPSLVLERGMSIREIIDHLTTIKAPVQGTHSTTRPDGGWAKSTVRRLVSQPFYAGKLRYGETTRLTGADNEAKQPRKNPNRAAVMYADHSYQHPWTWATFEAMQEVIEGRVQTKRDGSLPERQVSARHHASPNPLAGIAVCGYCSYTMIYRPDKRRGSYLICSTHNANRSKCQVNRVPVNLLLSGVWERLNLVAEMQQTGTAEFERWLNQHRDNQAGQSLKMLADKKAGLERKLQVDLARRERALDNALLEEVIDGQKYKELAGQLKQERVEVMAALQECEVELTAINSQAQNQGQLVSFLEGWQEFYSLVDRPIAEWSADFTRQIRATLKTVLRGVRVKSRYDKEVKAWKIELNVEWLLN